MYELIQLVTREQFAEEGNRMNSAVQYFFDNFQQKGISVYSLRLQGSPVLTLSVSPEMTCAHVVGPRNREPSTAEFAILTPMLDTLGITLNYDRNSTS